MTFSSHRTRFNGKLLKIEVKDLNKLDFSLDKIKDRKKYIEEKYERVSDFYNEYTMCKEKNIDLNKDFEMYSETEREQYYKYNLNCNDDLSSSINIFQICERDASYLLNSKDIERDGQQKYNFLSENEFSDKLASEKSMSLEGNATTLDILTPVQKNNYKRVDYKIKEDDLNHPNAGVVLREYNEMRNYLIEQMRKIKNKEEADVKLHVVRKILKDLNSDMILAKVQLRGIRNSATKLGDEKGAFDMDRIDYKNPKHIKALIENIPFGEISPVSDLSHMAYDIEHTAECLHEYGLLDDIDMEILECMNSKYTQRAMAEEIGIAKTTVTQRISKICKRISEAI